MKPDQHEIAYQTATRIVSKRFVCADDAAEAYQQAFETEATLMRICWLVSGREVKRWEKSLAEAILQEQIAAVFADQGLAVGGQTVPPVSFHFTLLPLALIVSPRNEIKQAAKSGVVHKSMASRKRSRLAVRLATIK